MRWRAFFFLNPDQRSNNTQSYGFQSKKLPPPITQLVNFEKRLINMIENVKFRNVSNRFQSKLSSDIRNIKKTNELFVPADKTTNYYKMTSTSYNELLHKKITKTYKKANTKTISSIESTTKTIDEKLTLDNRMNITSKKNAFITLKDPKPNFNNNPICRLINPLKSEIGKLVNKYLIK